MNNFNKMKRKQETDFQSVEINTAHFDTVKCECFIMENLKKVMKSHKWIFNSPKEYKPWYAWPLVEVQL